MEFQLSPVEEVIMKSRRISLLLRGAIASSVEFINPDIRGTETFSLSTFSLNHTTNLAAGVAIYHGRIHHPVHRRTIHYFCHGTSPRFAKVAPGRRNCRPKVLVNARQNSLRILSLSPPFSQSLLLFCLPPLPSARKIKEDYWSDAERARFSAQIKRNIEI